MRKSLGIATFFVVGVGAAGAGALNNVQLKGSDTLSEITNDLLAVCPLADPDGADGASYIGGGSTNGETAMRTAGVSPNPQQTIAPMSRFLAGGPAGATCTVASAGGGAFGAPSTAEGLVIGMDGLSVVAARANGGSTTCNGAVDDCDAINTDPGAGLAFNTTVSTTAGNYTFNNWRDVLRVVFGGMDHSSGSNLALRNCNSPVRQAVVSNYNSLFQTPANCTTAACTQLRHAFIRDNESGTTDTFVSLLGLTSINITGRVSPFCNALRTSDALPGAAGETIRYFPDYQDFDPIRRTCATTEQVCHKNGNNIIGSNRYGLGVVVTVTPTDFIPTQAGAFPETPCQAGNFAYAPLVPQSIVFTPNNRCPNGDVAAFDSNCMYPRTTTNSYKCLNSIANRPSFVLNNALVEGREPSLADGRTYNLHLLKDPVAPSIDPTYEIDGRNRRMVGAFYRIHTTTSLASPLTCKNQDATSQIGCLVSASPCSIGFAGRGATDDNAGTAALKVNKLHPSAACVGTVAYPLSRKLYINTFQGFGDADVVGHELELVKCASVAGGPNGINLIMENRGFVPLPATAPGGAPYCEDFNETQCAGAANVNACTGNPSGVPSLSTVCGNGGPGAGDEEFGEQCDDGNNVAGDGCSPTCALEN